MRHVSPKEMVSMLGDTPVLRVIFRRPASGSGVVVELLVKNGEEIMISDQGTPDPVVFTSPAVMAFFQELGLFSGAHDEMVLDARHYRPAGFGFMQGRPEMAFGEIRKRGEAADALDFADEEPAGLQKSQFTTTIYTLNDAFSGEEYPVDEIAGEGLQGLEDGEKQAPEPKIGEKYLTTLNLIRLTGVVVVLQLVLALMLPPPIAAMKELLYICAGSMVVLAMTFVFFERRRPDHASIRVRRYLWLCLIVFNVSMLLSYVFAGKMLV